MTLKSLWQTATLSSGTVINSILGLVFYIVVARSLGVEQFGYFSFLLGIGVLAADLGDLGVNQSIIKFGHDEGFKAVFTVAFIQRLIVGIVLIGIAITVQAFYPEQFILSAQVGWSLLLVYIVLQSLLAKQKFLLYAFTNIVGNILRLGLLLLFINWQILNVGSALGTVILANVLAFLFGLLLLIIIERGLPFVSASLKQTVGMMLRFGSWIGLSFSTSALASKLDNPLVFSLAGAEAAGLYSSAQRLNSFPMQISGALDGVFAPKLAHGDKDSNHFKEYLTLSVVSAVFLLLSIPFLSLILNLVFGSQYDDATPLLQVMIVGLALFFLAGPFVSSVIYRFSQTKAHFLSSLIQLVVGVSLMVSLIPRFGAMGAAISFVIVNLLNLTIFASYYLLLSRRAHD